MTDDDVLEGVKDCLAAALDIDAGSIGEGDKVVDDLGADSLDFLDIIFHLEQRFKVRLSPRDVERRAKEALGGRPFEVNGSYTPEALAQIRAALPEIPASELHDGLTVADLPRMFRTATLVSLVCRAREGEP